MVTLTFLLLFVPATLLLAASKPRSRAMFLFFWSAGILCAYSVFYLLRG